MKELSFANWRFFFLFPDEAFSSSAEEFRGLGSLLFNFEFYLFV